MIPDSHPPRAPAGLASRSRAHARLRTLCIVAFVATLLGCERMVPAGTEVASTNAGGRLIHLHETHSSALIAWRHDGVRGRVLVHMDADLDLDWLPDETIARIAASHPSELARLEATPFGLPENELAHFGSGNFLYAAARMGIIREIVWVVPDGTYAVSSAGRRLVQDLLLTRLQMVTEEEAAGFREEGALIRGTLLGVPLTICRLADLPAIPEAALLDIGVGYFTRRSALETTTDPLPWTSVDAVVDRLQAIGLRPDVVTISLSTLDGGTPPASRWIARYLQARFRGAESGSGDAAIRATAAEAERAGDAAGAAEIYFDLALARPDDATVWYAVSRTLERAGRGDEAKDARRRAERLDPLLSHADLFEAEQLWRAGDFAAALRSYDAYLERRGGEGFAAYAERQRALCLLRTGQIADGIAALTRVAESYPAHARGHFELGVALRDQTRTEEAAAHLFAARELAPDVATYRIALGSLYLEQKRTLEAIRELEHAVSLRPCSVPGRARLVVALMRDGRREDAKRELAVALRLQPTNPRLQAMASAMGR